MSIEKWRKKYRLKGCRKDMIMKACGRCFPVHGRPANGTVEFLIPCDDKNPFAVFGVSFNSHQIIFVCYHDHIGPVLGVGYLNL